MEKEKVLFYVRTSTSSKEQESSYEVQKENCLRLLEQHSEWELATSKNSSVFGDKESGTKLKERIQFREMLKLCGIDISIKNNSYQITDLGIDSIATLIVVKSTSRFSRDVSTSIQILEYLFKKNVKVLFLNTGRIVSKFDLTTNILLNVDSEFSQSLSQNQKISYRKNVEYRQSIYNCTRLFGYDYVFENGRRVLKRKDGYQEIIDFIFNSYLQDRGCRQISTQLNEMGVRNYKGTCISESGVMSILRNVKYSGYLQLPHENTSNGIGIMKRKKDNYDIIECDYIEPYISLEIFNKVQKKIDSKPKKGNRGVVQVKDKYSKILICSDCFCHFTRQVYRPVKGQLKSHYYLCSRQQHRGVKKELEGCDNHIIQEYYLDEFFENLTQGEWRNEQILYKKSLVTKLQKLRLSTIETIEKCNVDKIIILEDELKKLREQQDDFILNRYNFKKEVITRQVNKLEEQIEKNEKEISNIENVIENGLNQIQYIISCLNEVNSFSLPEVLTKEDIINNTYMCIVYKNKITKENPLKKNNVILELHSNFQFKLEEFQSEVLDNLSFYPNNSIWNLEEDYSEEQKQHLEHFYNSLINK